MFAPEKWPFWAEAGRILLTLLMVLACGMHSWALFRSSGYRPSSIRWAFALYSAGFAFLAWANAVMLVVTLYAREYKQGPYRVGTFSLLLAVAYLFSASFRLRRGHRQS